MGRVQTVCDAYKIWNWNLTVKKHHAAQPTPFLMGSVAQMGTLVQRGWERADLNELKLS